MGLRYSQGKYSKFKYGPSDAGFQFKIQISNSAGVVQVLLNNQVASLDWTYKSMGGCGKFKCVLKRAFDNLTNLTSNSRREIYDFRVYITSAFGGTSTLFYRGYITSIRPSLSDSEQIVIDGIGYSERLKDLIVHDGTGAPKTYTASTISGVVTSLINDFVTANTPITAGTIDTFSTAVLTMKLGDSVWDAISKLADIVGAEWGVDRNLHLYFQAPSTTVGNRWMIGKDISSIDDEFDYSEIVNQVIVEGGDIDDGTGTGDTKPYRYIKSDTASIAAFGLHQVRISNSSVVDATVADQLASSLLAQDNTYSRNLSLTLPFNVSLLETSTPLSRVSIHTNPKQLRRKYGTFKYGTSGYKYSGEQSNRIDSISYSLKDVSLETYIELNYGKPDVTDRFQELEFNLDQQRQAAGV